MTKAVTTCAIIRIALVAAGSRLARSGAAMAGFAVLANTPLNVRGARRGPFQVLLAVLMVSALANGPADAAMIRSINADAVDVQFTVLSVPQGQLKKTKMCFEQDRLGIQVKYQGGGSQPYTNAYMCITTTITEGDDTSHDGFASGRFRGDPDSLIIQDANGTDLLTGNIDHIDAQEIDLTIPGVIRIHQIVVSGSFDVTGGTLAPQFQSQGEILSLQYDLTSDPDNFLDESFSAQAKVTLLPEPAMISFLGALGMVLLTNRNRKRRRRAVLVGDSVRQGRALRAS